MKMNRLEAGSSWHLIRGRTVHGDPRQARVAVHRRHAALAPHFDVRGLLDLLDQVVRHRGGQRFAANQHDHLARKFGKMHGRLARGIRAADDVYGLTLARQRFGRSAAIVNARALQLVDAGNIQRAPLHAHRQQQGVTRNLESVAQLYVAIRSIDANADRFLRRQEFRRRSAAPAPPRAAPDRRPSSPEGNPR